MYIGTTPTLQFTIDIDNEMISELFLTFQNELVEKTRSDCAYNGIYYEVVLSQEDTLKLSSFVGNLIEVQVRVKTIEGKAFAGAIQKISISKILKGGVI